MKDYELLRPGVCLRQDARLRLTTDALVLASFAAWRTGSRIADLGCGSGALSLLLLARDPLCRVAGLELDAQACLLAAQSRARSALSGRFTIVQGDLRSRDALLRVGLCDAAVCNPPYFPAGGNSARCENTCTLAQVCAAANHVLKNGGNFFLVHRPERLCDAICALRAAGLEPKRIRFVRHTAQSPINLILIAAKKGGKPGLHYEPDFILYTADGRESPEYRAICDLGGA